MLDDIDWLTAKRWSFMSKIESASENPLAQVQGRRGLEDDGLGPGRAIQLQATFTEVFVGRTDPEKGPVVSCSSLGQLTLSELRGRSNSQGILF